LAMDTTHAIGDMLNVVMRKLGLPQAR
jgi:hypothetical protein